MRRRSLQQLESEEGEGKHRLDYLEEEGKSVSVRYRSSERGIVADMVEIIN